jgi:hypothetical protein
MPCPKLELKSDFRIVDLFALLRNFVAELKAARLEIFEFELPECFV